MNNQYSTYNLLILTRKSSEAKYERIFKSKFVMLPKHLDKALKGDKTPQEDFDETQKE